MRALERRFSSQRQGEPQENLGKENPTFDNNRQKWGTRMFDYAAKRRPMLRTRSAIDGLPTGTLASQGSSTPIRASAPPAIAMFVMKARMLVSRSLRSEERRVGKECR